MKYIINNSNENDNIEMITNYENIIQNMKLQFGQFKNNIYNNLQEEIRPNVVNMERELNELRENRLDIKMR